MSGFAPIPRGPEELTQLLAERFRSRGHELYLVGGSVRDRLLGLPSPDLDLATSARPEETAEILGSLQLGEPYRVGEKYGTVGLRFDDLPVEVTTFRSIERYPPGSRKPLVTFGTSLAEDLERRDFTVNAMAMDPVDHRLIDPLHGVDDLERRLLRAVGRPAERFEEDPLRLLRAIRFATQLDFGIEPTTWLALASSGVSLRAISKERVRDEYTRIVVGPRAVKGLTLLRDSGLMRHSVPILCELDTMPDHGPRHPLSLWDHVMQVVAGVSPSLDVRWAAILHDIAKPRTRSYDSSGRPRFFHHEEVGAALACETLEDLRYPNALVSNVALLVGTHMQLHSYSSEWSDGAVRRLMLRLGPLLPRAIELARADARGHSLGGRSTGTPRFDELEARVRLLEQDGVLTASSPLSGHDLMERYGRGPGPWIRAVKTALEREVIDGRLAPSDRESAWRIADDLVGE